MEVHGMKPNSGFMWCIAVAGALVLMVGAFLLGRHLPADTVDASAHETVTTDRFEAPDASPDNGTRSVAFRPFAASPSEVFAAFASMREEMGSFAARAFSEHSALGGTSTPLRFEEEDGRYVARLPVKGLENGSVDIEVQAGMLIVHGSQVRGDGGQGPRSESRTFRYAVSLPPAADPTTLKTACTDEFLKISLEMQ